MIRPLLITASLLCANAFAQEITREADWEIPRTEYCHADLQGVWSFGSQTPFQRPQHLSDKAYYTPAEAAKIEDEVLVLKFFKINCVFDICSAIFFGLSK